MPEGASFNVIVADTRPTRVFLPIVVKAY
jgi:hypothetical protein